MTAELKRLLQVTRRLAIKSEDLDEFVHETAQEINLDRLNALEHPDDEDEHIREVEVYASEINNGGVEYQLAFLLRHRPFEAVKQLLAARVRLPDPGAQGRSRRRKSASG
jgi:hypothetical protein